MRVDRFLEARFPALTTIFWTPVTALCPRRKLQRLPRSLRSFAQ